MASGGAALTVSPRFTIAELCLEKRRPETFGRKRPVRPKCAKTSVSGVTPGPRSAELCGVFG